ncbi:MAG: hypothetical protein IKA31_00800, partial [Clostridia bacterium]|nr:hypothetical protein [Clostridia bacterium]
NEYNQEPYNPKFTFDCSPNILESRNYQNISNITLQQTFYPSNLSQGEISLYYLDNGNYTKVNNTAITATYGDTLTFFIAGGKNLVDQSNNSIPDNNYMLIVNSVFAEHNGDYNYANITYVTDVTDAALSSFTSNIGQDFEVSPVKVLVKFIKAGIVALGGYKSEGADVNSQTYVEGFTGTATITVNKKLIRMGVPNATMVYGTGTLVKVDNSEFVLYDDDLVNPPVDKATIIESSKLIIVGTSDYKTLTAGTYQDYVSVELNHENYGLVTGGIDLGDLTVNGQILTNDTEGVSIVLDDTNCIYNGQRQTPNITSISYLTSTLEIDPSKTSYYNAINAGFKTAYMTVTLIGNYNGTLTAYYSIAKFDISKANYASSLSESVEYNGSSLVKDFSSIENGVTKSKVSIPSSNMDLWLNTDFEIFYSNNINVSSESSKATISIAGKGNNVTGTHTIKFDILPQTITTADISDYTLEFESVRDYNYTYTGSAITPVVKYLYSETKGISFNVTDSYSYKDGSGNILDDGAINVGKYYVVATINGSVNSLYINYVGTVELE